MMILEFGTTFNHEQFFFLKKFTFGLTFGFGLAFGLALGLAFGLALGLALGFLIYLNQRHFSNTLREL